ncbi:GNAT family N-acetyltransferase [Flexithrix dorotheae]|uniref:GNAT family N-acetyltransferase n=1 Tax=Flexithrix dorotheae TaxID=70993 RepID=UPI0003613154|nr:GNAT family N-acetyltransferase [Flexithrix dorotheae]
MVKIYSKQDIHLLDWERINEGNKLKCFLEALVTKEPHLLVKNVHGEFHLLAIDEILLPILSVSTNSVHQKSTYISSIISQYLDYAKEELLSSPKLNYFKKAVLRAGFQLCKSVFRAFKADDVVFINNWLVSTNLYPDFSQDTLNEIKTELIRFFPGKAIVFRSVCDRIDDELKSQLQNQGFSSIVSRHIFLFDPAIKKNWKKRANVIDQKLWDKSDGFTWVNGQSIFERDHLGKALKMYFDLYIEKHSPWNPKYDQDFLSLALKSGFLDIHLLKFKEEVCGVQAIASNGKVMTTPFIGYDQSFPKEAGLYRFLNLQLINQAREKNFILNMSSGADTFKKQRGGTSSFEYNMVYFDHLPVWRRWFWKVFDYASEKIIKPGLLHYKA